jgi:hypothetical protein
MASRTPEWPQAVGNMPYGTQGMSSGCPEGAFSVHAPRHCLAAARDAELAANMSTALQALSRITRRRGSVLHVHHWSGTSRPGCAKHAARHAQGTESDVWRRVQRLACSALVASRRRAAEGQSGNTACNEAQVMSDVRRRVQLACSRIIGSCKDQLTLRRWQHVTTAYEQMSEAFSVMAPLVPVRLHDASSGGGNMTYGTQA